MAEENEHLWNQFIKLGEMMGDGLHNESDGKWISREYKKLSKILIPDIKEADKELRKIKNKKIDERVKKLLLEFKCDCGGSLKQARSGSIISYCGGCNKRYKARRKK